MKEKIELDWEQDQLNSFLKNNFKNGLNVFELSFIYTFVKLRFFNLRAKSWSTIEIEIKRLQALKEKLVKIFYNYLSAINFYKSSPTFDEMNNIGVSFWTPADWRSFIQSKYRLEPIISMIDMQIDWLKARMTKDILDPLGYGIEIPVRIKPIYFLILVWAKALRKGKTIDWINMELLIKWILHEHNDPELNEFYDSGNIDEIFPGLAQQKLKRFKNTNPSKLADFQYKAIFENPDKAKYLEIMEKLRGLLGLGFLSSSEDYCQTWARIFCIAVFFPEKYAPLYKLFSGEIEFPKEMDNLKKA